jgi:hypothetical protein
MKKGTPAFKTHYFIGNTLEYIYTLYKHEHFKCKFLQDELNQN